MRVAGHACLEPPSGPGPADFPAATRIGDFNNYFKRGLEAAQSEHGAVRRGHALHPV